MATVILGLSDITDITAEKLIDGGVKSVTDVTSLSINQMREKFGLNYIEAVSVFASACRYLLPFKARFEKLARKIDTEFNDNAF